VRAEWPTAAVCGFYFILNNFIFKNDDYYKLTTSHSRRPTAARPSTPRTAAAAVWQSPPPLATPLHLAAPPRRPSAAPLCQSLLQRAGRSDTATI